MKRLALLLALFTFFIPLRAHAAGDLESVKALYAAASYEEALVSLDRVDTTVDPIQVNQYRALCLLALGRARDAEAPLQQIVSANPLYVIPVNEVSPRLVELFKEVRRRLLPTAARQLYVKAKASYDSKNFSEASAQFKTLLAVLGDPDAAARGEVNDLKDLAEGFLALAGAQVSSQPPPAPTAPPTPPPAVTPAVAESGEPSSVAAAPAAATARQDAGADLRIYSSADTDVKPAIELQRTMPRWMPTTAAEQLATYRGTLRVVVNESGQVESANLLAGIYPTYNDPLLRIAKTWRYRPATRQGRPVKYALTLDIVLRPNGTMKE